MKGTIVLSEGRSGTNWLGSLTNSTGELGVCGEYVDPFHTGANPKKMSYDEYIALILKHSATPNGYFAIKMFPRHLHWFQVQYGCDFIKCMLENHNVNFMFLTREDRVGQAISFSKALQTGAWSEVMGSKRAEVYDFDQIFRAYFMIGRSYDFWRSYISVMSLNASSFVYEELLPDPEKWVETIADHAGISRFGREPETNFKIQRNQQTDEWRERFAEDVKAVKTIHQSTPSRPATRHLDNLICFFRGRQMRPVPYGF